MACPICSKATSEKFRPFCSKHCADIDLGRWFNGTYTIPDEDSAVSEASESDPAEKGETRH